MSHAACNYVKHLKVSPIGEKLTAVERLTLFYLADNHSEKQFVQGMLHAPTPLICDAVGVGPADMMQIISDLVRKGILRSAPYVDEDDTPIINVYFFTDPSLNGTGNLGAKTE